MKSEAELKARRDELLNEMEEINAEHEEYSREKLCRAMEYIEHARREVDFLNWVLNED